MEYLAYQTIGRPAFDRIDLAGDTHLAGRAVQQPQFVRLEKYA